MLIDFVCKVLAIFISIQFLLIVDFFPLLTYSFFCKFMLSLSQISSSSLPVIEIAFIKNPQHHLLQ